VSDEKDNPQTDSVIHVKIAFDMKTNQCTLSSKCPAVMLYGILETAKSMVMQNQFMAQVARAAEAAKSKVVAPPNAGLVIPQ